MTSPSAYWYIMMTPNERDKQDKLLTEAHHDHKRGMRSYTNSKVSNGTAGEDLVQDTFIKTWVYLVKGGKIVLMKAFLYHILNQLIIDEYRKRKTVSLDSMTEKGFEPGFDDTERIADSFNAREALLLIQHLPKKYERVVRMRYEQDLSIKEISLITGQTRNAVAVQAHRGLEKLRKLYSHM